MTVLKVNHINWTSKWEATSSSKDPMEYVQYLTEESSKPQEQQQYILLRFAKSIERETPTDGIVNQHNSPNQTGTLTRKWYPRLGLAKLSNPRWSRWDLNEIKPNFSRRYKRPRGVERTATPKLWRALGPTQANHKKINTANKRSSPKFVTLRRDRNQS